VLFRSVQSEADVIFLRYPIFVQKKPPLLQAARKSRLDIAGWYFTPVHPVGEANLNAVDYEFGMCPRAENIIKHLVHIPTGISMNPKRLDAMITLIKKYVA